MHIVTLSRDYRESCTLGSVILPSGRIIKALERPWLGNQANVSCYPEGAYIAKWIERSGSGKYKRVWHVQSVAGRSGILWHVGNLVRHSRGCTLPGLRHGRLRGKPAVLSSLSGLNAMRRELEGQDFILIVTSFGMDKEAG